MIFQDLNTSLTSNKLIENNIDIHLILNTALSVQKEKWHIEQPIRQV